MSEQNKKFFRHIDFQIGQNQICYSFEYPSNCLNWKWLCNNQPMNKFMPKIAYFSQHTKNSCQKLCPPSWCALQCQTFPLFLTLAPSVTNVCSQGQEQALHALPSSLVIRSMCQHPRGPQFKSWNDQNLIPLTSNYLAQQLEKNQVELGLKVGDPIHSLIPPLTQSKLRF